MRGDTAALVFQKFLVYFAYFLPVFLPLYWLWKDCFDKYYTMWIVTINIKGPPILLLSSHREIKVQETLQTKWEVHSYPVKAIKTEEARLSLHKLPETESMGKYTEAHNINSACFLCTCVCVLGIHNKCNCSCSAAWFLGINPAVMEPLCHGLPDQIACAGNMYDVLLSMLSHFPPAKRVAKPKWQR